MEAISKSSMLRFSIRHLLAWTVFVAFGCIALRSASTTWVAAVFGLVLLFFAAALLLVIFGQAADRAYWVGFALIGWLYLILLMYGWGLDPNSSQNNPLRPSNLITGRLSALCYDRIYSSSTPQYVMGAGFGASGFGMGSADGGYGSDFGGGSPAAGVPPGISGSPVSVGYAVPVPTFAGPTQDEFVNVAHALWALILAACGGWFAQWLYVVRPAQEKCAVEKPS